MNNNDGWEKVSNGEQAEAWKFKEDKVVQGKYVEKRDGLGHNNATMYILEQPDGTLAGVWETAALRTKFESVVIGDEVKIEYLGVTKSKTGNNYHNFDFYRRPGSDAEATDTNSGDDTEDIFNDLP